MANEAQILFKRLNEFTQSLSPRAAHLNRSRGMLAHLLWSLPSGVLTCFSAGGRGPGSRNAIYPFILSGDEG